MGRKLVVVLVLALVLAHADAHNRQLAADNCHREGESYHCHGADTSIDFSSNHAGYYPLVKVTDGDTLSFQFHDRGVIEVRLYGVNTPELSSRDEKEKEAAEQAKKYVADKLEDKDIFLLFDNDNHFPFIQQGKYGRYLTYLFYVEDGKTRMLNFELIKDGHSEVDVINSPFRYRWAFIDIAHTDDIDIDDVREKFSNFKLPDPPGSIRVRASAFKFWAYWKADRLRQK